MRKLYFTLFLTFVVFSMSAQHRADRQNLTDENSSTMILLGDPQGYTKYDVNNPLLGLQMCWIHDNIDHLNIKAVLCVGDLVEQNDYSYMDRRMVNQTSRQMWEKLFSQVPNIRLVLCGHHGHGPEEKTKADEFWKNVGWRTDPNTAGYNVHQMMFNVQTLGGGWEGNGGDCWLRILEFMPDGKTVKVRTYSPLFGISPSTKHLAHRSKSYDQFDFVIE